MIDGQLSVRQSTLCMAHSALSYMHVWAFCSKVTRIARLLQLTDRVELTNHNSVTLNAQSQPEKDKEFL